MWRGVRGPHVLREDRVAVGRLRRGRQTAQMAAVRAMQRRVRRRDRRPGRSQLCLKSYRAASDGQRGLRSRREGGRGFGQRVGAQRGRLAQRPPAAERSREALAATGVDDGKHRAVGPGLGGGAGGEHLDAEDPGLLADYLTPDAITFVEWPERTTWAGTPTLRIHLEHRGKDHRQITTLTTDN